MQKRILIASSILLVTSCASVGGGFPKDTNETTTERATRCYYENIEDYWGDCWIKESKEEPTFLEWVYYLNMIDAWDMLQDLNDKLVLGLEDDRYNVSEANQIFGQAVTDIDAIVNAKIQTNLVIAEQKRQQIGMALMAVSASISQTNQTIKERQANQEPITIKKYLTSQTPLGDGRIQCTYGVGITATVIVNYGSFCAPSI